jgi:DNA replication protein DnaC
LELRVGERISSRLYEMCEFIYLEGNDFRMMRKKF